MDVNAAPAVPLAHLDQLWFQVAGTLCNLTCTHCFISCSPHNHSFGFMTLADVRRWLEDSVRWGVNEYYFTGGEPFLNPDMTAMLCESLRYGATTVLTNATVLKDEWLGKLAAAEGESVYSLEFRVSIDGFSPETNDPIRGQGTFARAVAGVRKLVEFGFLPIITAARTWADADEHRVTQAFVATLRAAGYDRPRLKILPTLRIGAEERRTHGYASDDCVTAEMMQGYDASQLICQHSRTITNRGVYVCPILLEFSDARLGDDLDQANRPFPLSHGACWTCYQYGAICTNPSSALK